MTLFVRATGLVNETPAFLDTQGSKTPEPTDIKLDYVENITPHANCGLHIREIVILLVYF